MGSKKVTPQEIRQYVKYRREGWTIKEAASLIGRSESWAKTYERKRRHANGQGYHEEGEQRNVPSGPVPLDELKPEARRALDDFGYWRARYLGRISTPWQEDAAHKTAELYDSPFEEYVVVNCPPGSGKTTLFTHDIPAWLTCRERTIRGLLGHYKQAIADTYTARLKRTLERPVPLKGKLDEVKRGLALDAEACLAQDYGSFKPENGDIWTRSNFTVAQYGETPVDEKESTWVSFGMDSGFLGWRVKFINWDDLVNRKTIRTIEAIEAQREWWDNEGETRLEPGGLLLLVGQRLSSSDLYRYCLDKVAGIEELDGEEDIDRASKMYHHIIYRAHDEKRCRAAEDPSVHDRDATPQLPDGSGGCLLDPRRLNWRMLENKRKNSTDFATVYQQEDADPSQVLVPKLWVTGGVGTDGVEYPGCWDNDRGLWEIPEGLVGSKYMTMTVDPSPTRYWSVQCWLYVHDGEGEKLDGMRYLVDHVRKQMDAPSFLDWNASTQTWSGLAEEWVQLSKDKGVPITRLVMESNAAQRFMLQYDHVKRWQSKRGIDIVPHQTHANKADPELGVWTVRTQWRYGRIRLPGAWSARPASLKLVDEVTRWPDGEYDDCVMAHWFHEFDLPNHVAETTEVPSLYNDIPSWINGRGSAGARFMEKASRYRVAV